MNKLPLRNFKQTAKQLRGFGSTVKSSYGNYGGAIIKTRERAVKVREQARYLKAKAEMSKAELKRKGFERYALGLSIYQKSPSEMARNKLSRLRKRLGGGIY